MKVKKIFPCFARTDWRYAPLYTAFRSAGPNTKLLPAALHSISTPSSTFLDPPLHFALYRPYLDVPAMSFGEERAGQGEEGGFSIRLIKHGHV